MTTTPTLSKPVSHANTLGKEQRFIPEVQGLRTVALVMVVVYHVWFNRVSGGVDIFLMVSTYLMTRSLLSRYSGEGWFNPASFFVRRFSRLLPLAAVTIVLTLIAAFLIVPPWRFEALQQSALASLFYNMNGLLQDRAVDYFAIDTAIIDPFQHFWSLSIQGQAFILWAIAHLIAVVAARLTKIHLRWWLLIGFAAIFLLSFGYGLWLTDVAQTRAYFDTPARLWEFAFGSLLALLPQLRIKRITAQALTYVGLVLMLSCAFVLPIEAAFPGAAALWPLAAGALIIIAATAQSPVRTVLSHVALVRVGAYTYALYLIHWPILIFAQLLWRTEQLNFLQGVVVITLSAIICVALVHAVEIPLQKFDRTTPLRLWRPLVSVAAVAAVSLGAVFVSSQSVATRVAEDPGAQAYASWTYLEESCPADINASDMCRQTPKFKDAQNSVAFIGNSHMQQFASAFLPLLDEDWAARTYLAPGCQYRSEPGETDRDIRCHSIWDAAATGGLDPSTKYVVVLSSVSTPEGDSTPEGLDEWVRGIESQGIPVIAVRDNPRFQTNIFACGQQYGIDSPKCSFPMSSSWLVTHELPSASVNIDLTEKICPDRTCHPALNGEIVFLDSHHITASFAKQLSSEVQKKLDLTP